MKKGWETKKIGEVCEVMTGGTPSRSKPEYFGGTIKWLVSGDVNQGEIFDCEGRITEEGMRDSNAKLLPVNSVLMALNGQGKTRGTVALLRTQATCNQSLVCIYPKALARLLPEYVYSNLHGRYQEIRRMTGDSGNDRRGLNMALIRNIEIPIAPIQEQERIVRILNEAFEGIIAAKTNVEKNLRNARAVFESHLHAVFTGRGEGWTPTTLGSEIDLLAGFAFKSGKYTNASGGIKLLRGDNIIPGRLRWDDVKKWPATDTGAYDRYRLREGDVVLAMDRPWVKAGLKHATVSADDLPCLLVQRVARLRGGAHLDNGFLMYLIGSGAFTDHILGVQTGIGVPHISGQQIKDFPFARPPVVEQRRIASKLESLHAETQHLEAIYQQKLSALVALKKSLLHQAFAGAL